MKSTGRDKYVVKQVGEYLVCAELGRRGYIATSFTGNVPEFDILATSWTLHSRQKAGRLSIEGCLSAIRA